MLTFASSHQLSGAYDATVARASSQVLILKPQLHYTHQASTTLWFLGKQLSGYRYWPVGEDSRHVQESQVSRSHKILYIELGEFVKLSKRE